MIDVVTNNTYLIHEETQEYPLTLDIIATRHINISFGPTVPVEFIAGLGYRNVNRTQKPVGDVVVEQKPEYKEGKYFQVFSSRPFNETELKQKLENKKRELITSYRSQYDNELNKGLDVINSDGGIGYLDISNKNQLNILLILENAKLQVNNNNTNNIYIKLKNNEIIYIEPIEVIELMERAITQICLTVKILNAAEFMVKGVENESEINLNHKLF